MQSRALLGVRRAVRCCAVQFGSVLCGAVRCGAVRCWPGRQAHEMAVSHSLPRHGPKPERATPAINYTARRLSSPWPGA